MSGEKSLARAYVDTNVFDYVALKHPEYGRPCKQITDDIRDVKLEAYCSYLVPIEILGSLSRVDSKIAAGAILAFFSFPIKMIPINEKIIREASEILLETGVGYDSIHAAAMKSAGLEAVLTEDTEHWAKIGNIKIIRPVDYEKARNSKIPEKVNC